MKKKAKNLSILMAASLVMLLFVTIKANAEEVIVKQVTEEYIQSMLDVLPDNIGIIDMSELEAVGGSHQASNMVEMKVKEIWQEKGFNYQSLGEQGFYIDINAYTTGWCSEVEDFYTAYIKISNNSNNNYYSKTIKFEYNNSFKRNSSDEQTVKNLKLPTPKYFIITRDNGISDYLGLNNNFTDYYKSLVNDETLTFYVESQAGSFGGYGNTCFHSNAFTLEIFKNGILYDVREIYDAYKVKQIIIPSNIDNAEEAYIDYAIPLIRENIVNEYHDDNINVEKITLSKGADILTFRHEDTGIEIEDGYTIWDGNGNILGNVILKKAEPETVNKEDTATGVKLQTTSDVLSGNIVLSCIKVTEKSILNIVKTALKRISNKYIAYDINLLENNIKIQPNGKVKIGLPIPNNYNKKKLAVYRIDDNGEKIEYAVTIEEDYATFETDHFSIYVLTEKQENDALTIDIESEKITTNSNTDEVPNTGDFTNITALLILSLACIFIIFVIIQKNVLN